MSPTIWLNLSLRRVDDLKAELKKAQTALAQKQSQLSEMEERITQFQTFMEKSERELGTKLLPACYYVATIALLIERMRNN